MKITVWGAGSWGTALAILLDNKGYSVCLWNRNTKKMQSLQLFQSTHPLLKKRFLPQSIQFTSDPRVAHDHATFHVLSIPSHALRDFLKTIAPIVRSEDSFLSTIKGLENKTLKRMSEVIEETLGQRQIACLTGPTHAEEVIEKKPSAAVVGSNDPHFSKFIQDIFSTEQFRIYTNDDLVGIELGGSLKNVIAVAAGISDGLGFGANSKSALITRGLSEIQNIAFQQGALEKTLMGLSGVGDLITTCISAHSRNRHLGECLGKGLSLEKTLNSMTMVAEGIHTTKSALALSQKLDVESPIICNVYSVLFEKKLPQKALHDLFNRPPKKEEFSEKHHSQSP